LVADRRPGGIMAELTAFGYIPGNCLLHRLDVRVKLAGLLGACTVALQSASPGLLVLGLLLGLLMTIQRLPLKPLLRQLRLFCYLLALVWVARALATPGVPLWSWGLLTISRAGIVEGGLTCSRLVLTLLAGLLFTAATRPAELKTAVHWIFRRVPGIPAERVAVMAGLMIRFFPVILITAEQVRQAQAARCIQHRKNPIYRTTRVALPVLRKTFQMADELALAMESRCYTGRRTDPGLSLQARDRWALTVLAGLLIPLMLI